jgi:TonB family protein
MKFPIISIWLATFVLACSFVFPSCCAFSQQAGAKGSDLDLYPYEQAVQKQIKGAWAAPNLKFAGCNCTFSITASGDMTGLTIKDSSGADSYDQTCLDAIGRSAPFAPIPKGASALYCTAHFDIGGGENNVNVDMAAVPILPGDKTVESAAGNQAVSSLSSPVATISAVDLSPYITAAKSKIEQTWAPPIASAGLVSCAISIGPLGNLSNIKVIPSFGTADFNNSASDAIAKCDPFGQLPQGVNALSLMVTFEKSGQTKKVDAVQN